MRANTVAFGYIQTRYGVISLLSLLRLADFWPRRLTDDSAKGVAIEIGGKKVALGIPGGSKGNDAKDPFPHIPLRRGAVPDEAAASMLLYVLSVTIPYGQK